MKFILIAFFTLMPQSNILKLAIDPVNFRYSEKIKITLKISVFLNSKIKKKLINFEIQQLQELKNEILKFQYSQILKLKNGKIKKNYSNFLHENVLLKELKKIYNFQIPIHKNVWILNFRSIEIFVFSIFEFYNFSCIVFQKCRNSYFKIDLAEY